jgi:hypothetical protein
VRVHHGEEHVPDLHRIVVHQSPSVPFVMFVIASLQ